MDEVRLNPDRATGAGADLAASGRQLARLRTTAGGDVSALSDARPWGDDDGGQAFEQNYRPAEQQLLEAWEAIGNHVEGLGDAVVQAVRALQQTDTDNATRVRKA